MEYENIIQKDIKNYPKINSFKLLGKKTKIPKKSSRIFDKNPKINYFNISSHFIYDQGDFLDYYESTEQKNNIKLNLEEYRLMNKTIEDIEMIKSIGVGENYIFIDKNIFNVLNTFSNIKKQETEIEKYIKEKIKNSLNRNDITCQKLSLSYFNETGKFICKSSIHNIEKII